MTDEIKLISMELTPIKWMRNIIKTRGLNYV
jgi:hypothetical protein